MLANIGQLESIQTRYGHSASVSTMAVFNAAAKGTTDALSHEEISKIVSDYHLKIAHLRRDGEYGRKTQEEVINEIEGMKNKIKEMASNSRNPKTISSLNYVAEVMEWEVDAFKELMAVVKSNTSPVN